MFLILPFSLLESDLLYFFPICYLFFMFVFFSHINFYIFNCLAHDEIEVKGIHSGHNIYPNVNLEEDIEVIFSFSLDHLSL